MLRATRMIAEIPSSCPKHFALWREAREMHNRTKLGSSFYLVAWLLTWLALPPSSQLTAYGLLGSVFFWPCWSRAGPIICRKPQR